MPQPGLGGAGNGLGSGVNNQIGRWSPSQAAGLLDLAIDVKRDYGASGSAATTTGSISAGSDILIITGTLPTDSDAFQIGQGINVAGAGASSALLVSTIIDIRGNAFTLADAASTTVAGATVSHDDTAAVRSFLTSAPGEVGRIPAGRYLISGPLTMDTTTLVGLIGDGINVTYLDFSPWSGTGYAITVTGISAAILRGMSIFGVAAPSNGSAPVYTAGKHGLSIGANNLSPGPVDIQYGTKEIIERHA